MATREPAPARPVLPGVATAAEAEPRGAGGRLAPWRLRLAAVALAAGIALLFRGLRHDDAYIAFQYARHLATGMGPVFDAGERVLGFTSPLHVLLLAVAWRVGLHDLPEVAVALGSLSLAAVGLAVFRLLEPCSRAVAGAAALACAAGLAGSHQWLALESNLFLALLLAAVHEHVRDREASCGVLLGLAILARFDGALMALLLAADALWRRRRLPVRTVVAAAAVVLPWLVFADAYYGSALPHTLEAKRGVTPAAVYLHAQVLRLVEQPWRSALPEAPAAALAFLTPLLWLAGLAWLRRRAPALWPLPAFSGGLLLTYGWIGAPVSQGWHLHPASVVLVSLAVVGALAVAGRLRGSRGRLAAVAAVWLALAAAGLAAGLGARTMVDSYWFGGRDRRYGQVARWVRANLREGAALQAREVGTLGYRSGLRMVDACGLVDEIGPHPQPFSLAHFLAVAESYRPDALLLEGPLEAGMVEAGSPYRVVVAFPPSGWAMVAVREPRALRRPSEYDALRARAVAARPPARSRRAGIGENAPP
jgi:hypothetical protein